MRDTFTAKNHDGQHVMSEWWPESRNVKYRYCLIQFCNHVERREVNG